MPEAIYGFHHGASSKNEHWGVLKDSAINSWQKIDLNLGINHEISSSIHGYMGEATVSQLGIYILCFIL